jgi:hypothetical protein
MITLKHLEIYRYYGGDGDALIRMGSEEDKKEMPYEVWKTIDELIQDISLIKSGITSKSFITQVNLKLKSVCQNQEVIEKMSNFRDENRF